MENGLRILIGETAPLVPDFPLVRLTVEFLELVPLGRAGAIHRG
jgi:hypothetical protein